jgi:branched-subunit amino acid aminotransferase/4-amino-4-deoxychorismate lyase
MEIDQARIQATAFLIVLGSSPRKNNLGCPPPQAMRRTERSMPESQLDLVQLFSVSPDGPQALPVPEGVSLLELMGTLPQGVYSGLRTLRHDRFLWLDEHIARTVRSMRGLGWDWELDEGALRRALHRVCTDWPTADARVRFDVLEAPPPGGDTSSRVVIGLSPYSPVPAAFLREGVRVEIAERLRRDRPRIKTTEFILRRQPYPLSRQDRYEHLLVDDENRILECTSANFFGVSKGGMRTSGPGVLEGITRKIFMRIADELEIAVSTEPVALEALGELDEAFLTSSTRGLVPIVDVAGTPIGDACPGPVTQRLREAYEAFAEREARAAV